MQRTTALRNIALSFTVLTLALVGFVGYTAFSRAVVTVKLAPVEKPVTFRVTIADPSFGAALNPDEVAASFLETSSSASDTFTPSGTGGASGKPGGAVTITNETDRAQSLIATTRFLAASGILFRLKEAVQVPAHGSVSAVVEADKDTDSALVAPTKFTIPGLPAALQQVIYASSSATMARGGAGEKVVTDQDIATARATLRQRLLDEAQKTFAAQVGEGKIASSDFVVDPQEEKISVKSGQVARAFTVAIKLHIVTVVFDKDGLLQQVGHQVSAMPVDATTLRYTISGYDPVARRAIVSGDAKVKSSLNRQSSIFAPAHFVGWTPDEVAASLKNYEGVSAVDVMLSPYWQRHLPRWPSRISVEFKD